MEPTGIEPVTSCLQSNTAKDLEGAKTPEKSGESDEPGSPAD
jgi:hypothetical protein